MSEEAKGENDQVEDSSSAQVTSETTPEDHQTSTGQATESPTGQATEPSTGPATEQSQTTGQATEPPTGHATEPPPVQATNPPTGRANRQATGQTNAGVKPKIELLLKPTGGVLIMKRNKWAVDGAKKVGWVVNFIQRALKCTADQTIFLYVNQSFAPALDVQLCTLYDCFGANGRLVLHYCQMQAWG